MPRAYLDFGREGDNDGDDSGGAEPAVIEKGGVDGRDGEAEGEAEAEAELLKRAVSVIMQFIIGFIGVDNSLLKAYRVYISFAQKGWCGDTSCLVKCGLSLAIYLVAGMGIWLRVRIEETRGAAGGLCRSQKALLPD